MPIVQVSLLLPSDYKAGLTTASWEQCASNSGYGVGLHPAAKGVGSVGGD